MKFKLTNGSEIDGRLVADVFNHIFQVQLRDPVILSELVKLCKDPTHKILLAGYVRELEYRGLISKEGIVPNEIRNIVLCASPDGLALVHPGTGRV